MHFHFKTSIGQITAGITLINIVTHKTNQTISNFTVASHDRPSNTSSTNKSNAIIISALDEEQ